MYPHWSQAKLTPWCFDSTCSFRLSFSVALYSHCIGHTYSKLLHDLIHHVSLDYSSVMLCIHIGHRQNLLHDVLILHEASWFPVYLIYIHIPDIDTPDVRIQRKNSLPMFGYNKRTYLLLMFCLNMSFKIVIVGCLITTLVTN